MSNLSSVFTGSTASKEQILSKLENALYKSDVGTSTTKYLIGELNKSLQSSSGTFTRQMVTSALKSEMIKLFDHPTQRQAQVIRQLKVKSNPCVLMVVGVNGVGKTTTIGKISHLYKHKLNRNLVIAAADTTRAAAVDQLQIWGERNNVPVISRVPSKQASSAGPTTATKAIRQVHERISPDLVVHDAFQHIKSGHSECNLLIIDTAGRLQTNSTSMDELQQIFNACAKAKRGSPDYVWLVLDATIGQNSIEQAKEFSKRVRVNGIIVTKLDGSAKGGVILGIANTLKIPILYVGVGEKVEDLKEFDPQQFVDSILENAEEVEKQVVVEEN